MKLSLYISHTDISYVMGENSTKSCNVMKAGRVSLSGEAVANGENLQDMSRLKELLYELKNQVGTVPKNVDVLLSTTLLLNKLVEVPILSQKKLLEITRSEMQEYVDSRKDYVYDYSVIVNKLPDKKAGQISCVAMEREMYDQFMNCFRECEILVTSMDITLSAQIQMIRKLMPNTKESFILGVMDGKSILTSLYIKGQLVYNSSAVVSMRDNLGVISDLIRVLSAFIQYNKSQKNDTEIAKIYMVGMHESEREYVHNIQNALSIQTQLLEEYSGLQSGGVYGYSMQEYFYPTGNLFRK